MNRSSLPFFLSIATCAASFAQSASLSRTQPLTMEGDLSAQMVAGIGKYLDREAASAAATRLQQWKQMTPADREAMRKLLRLQLGMTDAMKSGGLEVITPLAAAVPQKSDSGYRVLHVRWPVLEDVWGEGVLLQPMGTASATVVAVPDADQTPEQVCGLAPGVPAASQYARRLAEQGCTVLIPVLVDRRDTWSGSEHLGKWTNQPHREWIYRQAFEVGRTVTGYEVQKVLCALDALGCTEATKVGIFGYGEGGLIALHAAALDARIDSAVISGHFGPHQQLWAEPIYRNLFGYQRHFGDAELAALAAPRAVIVENAKAPEFTSPLPVAKDRRPGAAPGVIKTPALAEVEAEIQRARQEHANISLIPAGKSEPVEPGSDGALGALLKALAIDPALKPSGMALVDAGASPAASDERQRRTVKELERHTQRVLEESEVTRYASDLWKKLAPGAAWTTVQTAARKDFWENVIGKLPTNYLPANPRSRKILEHEKWTGYDVMLDVHPDIFAWGVLLLPKDLKPGERRPVVVCQHGLEGVPMDTITEDQSAKAWPPYKGFAARLADQGFIVFAPHNPYRGQDAFRTLQRKAQPLGWSLFSIINAQHDVITRWLTEQPFVDPERIAFYGLSYGGKSAMRIPAVIERYCLSICSGDFNEWVRKNAWIEYPGTYLFTPEYEIFEWDLAHTFNYAEMALLIEPRPFMVERGHKDGVGSSEWVGYEFAKVLRGYTQLGHADRAEIEWFDGPHTINGVGTFKFLHRHLNWPERN